MRVRRDETKMKNPVESSGIQKKTVDNTARFNVKQEEGKKGGAVRSHREMERLFLSSLCGHFCNGEIHNAFRCRLDGRQPKSHLPIDDYYIWSHHFNSKIISDS